MFETIVWPMCHVMTLHSDVFAHFTFKEMVHLHALVYLSIHWMSHEMKFPAHKHHGPSKVN